MSSAYSPLFSFSFIFHFVLYNKVSHLLNQNDVGETPLSTTNENGEKRTLYIFWAQLVSVCTSVWVTYLKRMSSVFSVCLAYDERMRNLLSIRSHTLKIFEHVQKNILASAYNNVHRRVPAYEERTRRMPSVPLTYICVYQRMIIRWHTLMPYAVVWLHFKTSKTYMRFLCLTDICVSFKNYVSWHLLLSTF